MLMNAPAVYQKTVDSLLAHLSSVQVYLDDVVIFSSTILKHIDHISQVACLVTEEKMKIKVWKCVFAKPEKGGWDTLWIKKASELSRRKRKLLCPLQIPKIGPNFDAF